MTDIADMTVEKAQRRVSDFLTGQMVQALRAVEYSQPRFDTHPSHVALQDAAKAEVAVRHVEGASDASYLVSAYGDELLFQVQLNVRRFVVIYRIPAVGLIDAETLQPRFSMWARGATHVGWAMHWRDAARPDEPGQRFVEIYCYANPVADFLTNAPEQLFWRTDITQMTRSLMLEAHRIGVGLSPRKAGFQI